MRQYTAFALLLLCASAFATFTYVGSFNGSNDLDSTDFYQLAQPNGLLLVDNTLYATDSAKESLYLFNASAYDGNGTPRLKHFRSSADTPFSNPQHMAYDNGTLYIADGSGKLRIYRGEGYNLESWSEASNFDRPSAVALDSDSVYVLDNGKARLFTYSRSLRIYQKVAIESGPSDGQLTAPSDIELYNGRFYISDSPKGSVFVYDSNFTFLYVIGRGVGGVKLVSPRGIQVYNDRLYVADSSTSQVVVFTLDGYPVETLGAETIGADFSYPEDIAVGNGLLYVTDTYGKSIKVFSINESTVNTSVVELINAANYSLNALQSKQIAADKLNITYDAGKGAEYFASASDYYSRFLFSSAAALAQKSIDESTGADSALSQAISLKVLQLVKSSQDRVAPYRDSPTESLAAKLAQFDNRINDAKFKLTAKSYSAAADSALELPTLASEIEEWAIEHSASAQEKEQKRAAEQYNLRIDYLSGKLSELKEKAAKYQQNFDFENADRLLASARQSSDNGEFDSANRSISLLQIEVETGAASLSRLSLEIDASLANITEIEAKINSVIAKPSLVPPDVSQELAQISSAKLTAYQNPALAVQMAKQASESVDRKSSDARALSLAVAAILVMFGLIALITIVSFIHIRNRIRARKKQEAKEAARLEREKARK